MGEENIDYLSDEYDDLEQRIDDLESDLNKIRSGVASSKKENPRDGPVGTRNYLIQTNQEQERYENLLGQNLQERIEQYEEDHLSLSEEISLLK